jgi:hypothetical protein
MLHLREGADPEQRPAQAGAGADRGESSGRRTGLNTTTSHLGCCAARVFLARKVCENFAEQRTFRALYVIRGIF